MPACIYTAYVIILAIIFGAVVDIFDCIINIIRAFITMIKLIKNKFCNHKVNF